MKYDAYTNYNVNQTYKLPKGLRSHGNNALSGLLFVLFLWCFCGKNNPKEKATITKRNKQLYKRTSSVRPDMSRGKATTKIQVDL